MTAPWDDAPFAPPPLPSRRPGPAVGQAAFSPPPGTVAPSSSPSDATLPLEQLALQEARVPVAATHPEAAGFVMPSVAPDSMRRTSHRRQQARRRSLPRHARLAVALVVLAGVVAVGLVTGFGTEPSAEPTVSTFLFDWQGGHFSDAAKLTTGADAQVVSAMQAELTDLDATAMFLSMGTITQSGHTAEADFTATVDLGQGGHQWTYQGHFTLRDVNGVWKVVWAPSVIAPGLAAGDRLAVQTSYAPRAPVLDAAGKSLISDTPVYLVGVTPGTLASPKLTIKSLARLTGLDGGAMLGQVLAAPPRQFMELLALSRGNYVRLQARLRKVPGLDIRRTLERLSGGTVAGDLIGQVGTEDSDAIRAVGLPYAPGETIGESGIEQTYQTTLAGTPATKVLVVNAAGKIVATLADWPGIVGTPVRTTLDGSLQRAASTAVAALPGQSAEIVAVQASTGNVLAVAEHTVAGHALPAGGPLDAKIEPGMVFTIVSAAALLGEGFSADRSVPCRESVIVGGQTFTTSGASGNTQSFATDFANDCGTAFANLSTVLPAAEFGATERGFGIGAPWSLPVQGFSGSVTDSSSQGAGQGAGLAAEAIGEGDVRVSPLTMALVAAEVDNGAWHAPVLLVSDPAATRQAPLSEPQLGQLRLLMRAAVSSGTAHAANVHGAPVFGQAGVGQTGKHEWLSWFVGYRGDVAITVVVTGSTASQAAAGVAAAFLSGK
jgi:cell division protein FtsI/penicillin-binding protein 2